MNEDYVSHEIAKQLRDLGFDWTCRAFYKTWDGWDGKTYLLERLVSLMNN